MYRKAVFGMLTLLFASMFTLASNIQLAGASGTIYIRANGSVDPPTVPISSIDNVTYTFTDNIYDEIAVERNNIIVDGNGFTLNGAGSGYGFYLSEVDNVTIQNTNIKNFSFGVYLSSSSGNTVSGNNITNNDGDGVSLFDSSSHNIFFDNIITNNMEDGIYLDSSSHNNTFYGNSITNSYSGVLLGSSDNKFYHNNFINNIQHVSIQTSGRANFWDDNYLSGGNYWDDYTGLDYYHGRYQDELGSDGIGDTPYVIDEDNIDNYPLMVPWETTPYYDWPMFHHDPSHRGYSASTAPNTNNTVWIYITGGSVFSSPAVTDHKIYVGTDDPDSKVYCLDATTGTKIWNYTTGYAVVSSPAVVDGKVYVGSDGGKIYCLRALDGHKEWEFATSGNVQSSPAIVDGKVYVGSCDDNVYCLNATTGTKIWNYTTGYAVVSSPAVVDGKVYVGSDDNKTYCLDATTGTHIWNYTTDHWVRSSPAIADGRVYVGSLDYNVYCLDATTGTKIWNYTTGGNVQSSPAVVDGKVYVGSWDDRVYCLDATTGAHIWNYTTSNNVYSSPAVADGKVYMGSNDSNVYCLNASTGALIWNYTTGGDVFSSPAVADGKVYVGSNDNKVYCFGPPAGIYDGAITNVTPSKTVVVQGYSISIAVTVENQGDFTEPFNVTVFYDETAITLPDGKNHTTTTLTSGNSTTLTIPWNTTGVAKGNYTITAKATPLPGETDTTDNTYTDGYVIVAMEGDLTGPEGVPDGLVDIDDVVFVAVRFGAYPGHIWWNPDADITNDNIIDIDDVMIPALHFGEIDP